jgi:hypothetical protein
MPGTAVIWRLMHRLPMYQACPRGPVNVAERLECEPINLLAAQFLQKVLEFRFIGAASSCEAVSKAAKFSIALSCERSGFCSP